MLARKNELELAKEPACMFDIMQERAKTLVIDEILVGLVLVINQTYAKCVQMLNIQSVTHETFE